MSNLRRTILLGALAYPLLAQTAAVQDPAALEHFEKKIRPILVSRCYPCHSAMTPKVQGGLQLDSAAGLHKGGNSGLPIVPGDPDSSLLIHAIRYSDPNLQMPPGKALSPEVVADFEQWIRTGAVDPRTETAKALPRNKSRDFWSFKKPLLPPVPDVSASQARPRNAIDNFIIAKLGENKLTPSPAADRRTLIRRATFDLIGLAPTPRETDAFIKDRSPRAFETVINRLLASPQYGVRWGRHWMDVSRYADTADGGDRFAFSYTYRDWVMKAFNEDLPYDQFVKKQLAADQLKPIKSTDLAALGFLTLGRSVPKGENDMIDDRIDAVTRGFLGMTVTCARCHDHKFDPIPTKDYYSFYGIIANSREPVEYPLLQTENASDPLVKQYREGLQRRLDALDEFKTKRHAELVTEFRQPAWIARYLLAARKSAKMSNSEIEALSRDSDFNLFVLRRWREYLNTERAKPDSVFTVWNAYGSLTPAEFTAKAPAIARALPADANPLLKAAFLAHAPASMDDVAKTFGELLAKYDSPAPQADSHAEELRRVLRADGAPANVPQADFIQIRGAGGDDNILRDLDTSIRKWEAQFGYRGIAPRAMALEELPTFKLAHVFVRGNPNNLGAEAPPHSLSALTETPIPFTPGSGRLDLANSIASRENPVTARVIVNRVWQWHFGRGIVNSPSDFGNRGDLPTQPELLDYLAVKFMDEGWSIKKLHHTIMLSSTYQQSSADRPEARALDPENKFLWRTNRQRLDYESLHDNVLAIAGQLDLGVGGLPFDLTAVPPVPRRAAYAYIERGHIPGELGAFDFAIPDAHVPQRFLTTVPQQALFFMNSPFIMEASRHITGRREIDSAKTPEARVQALYRIVLGRPASASELKLALEFVNSQTKPDAQPAPPPTWQYGLASFDAKGAELSFQPLRYFAEKKWQPAPLVPQPVMGSAELSEEGGMPPDQPSLAIVRRWVSPIAGTISITGTLEHKSEADPKVYRKVWTDGVHARIIRNQTETLAQEIVKSRKADLAVRELAVHPGEVIDFAVDCIHDAESDGFTWAPVIASKTQTWNAAKDFKGPVPLTLNPWEKYTQVLLQTNEFAFVD